MALLKVFLVDLSEIQDGCFHKTKFYLSTHPFLKNIWKLFLSEKMKKLKANMARMALADLCNAKCCVNQKSNIATTLGESL